MERHGAVLDVLVQGGRGTAAAKRLMRKLLKRFGRPRVIVTDKRRSYNTANDEIGLHTDHRQHKGLNNRAENSHEPTQIRERVMRCFKSVRQLQRVASLDGQVSKRFMGCRYNRDAGQKREALTEAMAAWERASCARWAAQAAERKFLNATARPLIEQVDNTVEARIQEVLPSRASPRNCRIRLSRLATSLAQLADAHNRSNSAESRFMKSIRKDISS